MAQLSKNQIPASLFSKTGNSIYNDAIRVFLAGRVSQWFADSDSYTAMADTQSFVDEFPRWIASSRNNRITGLGTFDDACVSLGVTQALDQFHYDIIVSGRKLRMFRGEYPYNRDVHPFAVPGDFIDDRPLEPGDAVILSCPFSASGAVHPRMYEILDRCQSLKVPVFVDLAWFGTCGGLNMDLAHPAVTHAAFSLTKGLTCGNYRSGVRFSKAPPKKIPPVDRLQLQHSWKHGVHLNTRIGLELMKNFGPDVSYEKYREAQLTICELHGLTPSLCVHIATAESPEWNDFSRDGFCNRINLKDAVKRYMSVAA